MRRTALALFLACLAVYAANGRPRPEVDCVAAPFTAWSLVRYGSFDLREYPQLDKWVGGHVRELPDGSRVSIRSPGSALAAVPFVAPFALFRAEPLGDTNMLQLGKLAAACCVAGAAVLFFLVCRRHTPDAAWPATVLFALGTSLCSVASQALWMHGPAVLGLCAALYCLVRDEGGTGAWAWQLGAGLALGFAALSRSTAAFYALATGVALLAGGRWRAALRVAAAGAVPVAWMVWLNWAMFGDPVLGGYKYDNWSESPPLWLGLSGLLVAPSRGLLVYTPAFLLSLLGAALLVRPGKGLRAPWRGMLLAWGGATAGTVFFYAGWHEWRGGWCYGPRLLCETAPALGLLFAVGYGALTTPWQRGAANGLIALSVAVHLLGLFGHSGYVDWHLRHERHDQGRCLFEVRDTQIEAHARAVLKRLSGAARASAGPVTPPAPSAPR